MFPFTKPLKLPTKSPACASVRYGDDRWTDERTKQDEHQGRGDPSSSGSNDPRGVYDDVPGVSVFEDSLQL